MDECKQGIHTCHANATCTNTIGAYACDCLPGFSGNGQNCEDTNECETIGICGINSECFNKFPGYTCACASGFAGSPCVDKNECLLGTHTCNSNQTCSNNIGGFTCPCSTGFHDESGICVGMNLS